MTQSRGAMVKSRGQELAPVRKTAFELWEQDPQIKGDKLAALLKERGHEVNLNTCNTWITRWRKGKGPAPSERAKLIAEMTPARKLAFSILSENPQIKGTKLLALLKERGHEVSVDTCYSWLNRWKMGLGYARGGIGYAPCERA